MVERWHAPERYVIDTPGVWIPGRLAYVLTELASLNERSLESVDPEARAVIAAVRAAGRRWEQTVSGNSRNKSAPAAETVSASSEMTVHQVATVLGLTDSRVRQLCRGGDLRAAKRGRRAWVIQPTDLAHYRAAQEGR